MIDLYESVARDGMDVWEFQHGRAESRDGERFTLFISAARNLRNTHLRLSYISDLHESDNNELAMQFGPAEFDDVARAVSLRKRAIEPVPITIEPPQEKAQMNLETEYPDLKIVDSENGKAISCKHGRIVPDGIRRAGQIEWDGTKFIAKIFNKRELAGEKMQLGYVSRLLNYGEAGELDYSFDRDSFAAVCRIMQPLSRTDD